MNDARCPGAWLRRNLALLFPLAAAAFFSLFRLGSRNLWWDEVLNFVTATQRLGDISPGSLSVIPFPPLYFQLLHAVVFFGHSEWVLRLLSAFFGILAVFVFFRFTERTAGRQAAFLGALLLALSPMRIWYSQEASPHIMEFCLVLLSNYQFYLFLGKPVRARFLKWVFFSVCAFYTANHTLLLLPAQLLFYYMMRQEAAPQAGKKYFYGVLLQLGLYVPQMFNLLHAVHSLEGFWIPPIHVDALAYSMMNFFLGYSGNSLMSRTVFAVCCVALAAVFFTPRLAAVRRVFIAFGLAPLAAVFLVHPFLRVYIDRHNLIFMAPFFMAAGAGIMALRPRAARLILACVLPAVLLLAAFNYCRNVMPFVNSHGHHGVYIKKDVAPVVRYITGRWQKGDLIATGSMSLLGPVNYYAPRGTAVYYLAAEHDEFWTKRMDTYKTAGFAPGEPEIVDARPVWGTIIFLDSPDAEESGLSALPDRVWLLQSSWSRQGEIELNARRAGEILRKEYTPVSSVWIEGVLVSLYCRMTDR